MNFYFGVLLPTCVIIVILIIVYVPIMKNGMVFDRIIKNSIENQRDEDFKRAQSAIIINIVVIVTWCLGVTSFYVDILSLRYLFCSSIVILSMVLFTSQVIFNKDAIFRLKKAKRHCCVTNYKVRREEEVVHLQSKTSLQSIQKKKGTFPCFSNYGDILILKESFLILISFFFLAPVLLSDGWV